MTAIWRDDGVGWRLLAPAGFRDEAALHGLVEQAVHMLPLVGKPQLVVVGREVLLGNNYADLLAVEPSGRLVIIEIKLARNAEARRAVIAQILTYAAYLRGLDVATLEGVILKKHLNQRGFANLVEAAASGDQTSAFDAAAFNLGLVENLTRGRFRLVLVLDDAPDELVRLVGYLEAVADALVVDLIVVSAYDIDGSRVLAPQRVDPERQADWRPTVTESSLLAGGRYIDGADDFLAAIESAPSEQHAELRRLTNWAVALEGEGLARLGTYCGASGRWTLLPYVTGDSAGLVTVWLESGGYLTLWRSVFLRRAPRSLARVEQLMAPAKVGQGTAARHGSDELLAALTDAYREAARGELSTVGVSDPTEGV